MAQPPATTPSTPAQFAKNMPLWQRLSPWAISLMCLGYLYTRLDAAAAHQGSSLFPYLAGVFGSVSWPRWLSLMIPYCLAFFLLDTLILWRVVNWFNTEISYADIIPVRASSYILSILNEQVSKGAVALYLHQRAGVPGWEVGSSMLFIMFCEFYYLLTFATVGVLREWDHFPEVFHIIPWMAVPAALFFVVFHLYFTGRILPGVTFRDKPLFHSFRKAKLWYYGFVVLMRTPMMFGAVIAYTLALRLFGIEASFGQLLGYLPVIFFGAATLGPMRSVAIVLWVILFPDKPVEITAFGFVQHNFFILFNAAIGLIFLRKALRELFGATASHS